MVNWKKWFLEEDEDEIFEEEVSRKEKKDDSLAGKERKTADKRKEMSEALHKSVDALESLTDKRWAYNAKDEGWSDVIDFIGEKK